MKQHEKMELRVGIFALLFVGVLVAVLAYVGIKKDLFADRISFKVISTTGENVERGIPVRLSGFRIGQVDDVNLSSVGKVEVEIKILEKYHAWFRKDSQIILVQGGFIGNTYLQLVPGSPASPILKEDSVITLNRIGGIDEIIAEAMPVIEDLKNIVANVKGITHQLLDEQGPVQNILGNVEAMSHDLRSRQGLIGYLTRDPEPVKKIDALLANSNKAMERINHLVGTASHRVEDLEPLQKEAVVLVKEVTGFVEELRKFREDLQPAVDNTIAVTGDIRKASKNLERLRARTEYSLRLGTELLQRLKSTWPLSRKAIEPPDQHPTPTGSTQ